MITFIACLAALVIGYFSYGKFVERFFGVSSDRPTPARRLADGVDYQEMKPWRIFIIQFLNIAGLGPIFGAILGAAYGPVAYIWIVLGCIFMGAAHDFFSGMLSVRNDGMSLPDMVGKYLGSGVKKFLVFFSAFILIAVGVSFVTGPADLLHTLTGWDKRIWLYIVFAYYIIATLLPVDKIIGKLYDIRRGPALHGRSHSRGNAGQGLFRRDTPHGADRRQLPQLPHQSREQHPHPHALRGHLLRSHLRLPLHPEPHHGPLPRHPPSWSTRSASHGWVRSER